MEDSILKLITIGYALGIAIFGVLAYLGIMGSFEAIDYQNKIARQKKLTESFNRNKQLEFQFKE